MDPKEIERLKYLDEDGIAAAVERYAKVLKGRGAELLTIVHGSVNVLVPSPRDQRLHKAAVLSVALDSVTSNLENHLLREEMLRKFRNVANHFEIDFGDIVRLMGKKDAIAAILFRVQEPE